MGAEASRRADHVHLCRTLRTGKYGPSRSLKNRISLSTDTSVTCSLLCGGKRERERENGAGGDGESDWGRGAEHTVVCMSVFGARCGDGPLDEDDG